MLNSGDAERVAAAVNACALIPTAMLEEGIVRRLLERRAEVLEAEVPGLREIVRSPSEH